MTARQSGLTALLTNAFHGDPLRLTSGDRNRMVASRQALDGRLATGGEVYGISRGFGPLVAYGTDGDAEAQGIRLIHHLCVGQGAPLGASETRLMYWLRLVGMRQGHSAVPVADWTRLAELYDSGFVPLVPSEGSLSASGDLVPLAHAALALAGDGEAWAPDGTVRPAAEALRSAGSAPVRWTARTALAFVNGSSASLAVAILNHQRLGAVARSLAAVTGRVAALLGCNPEAYDDALQLVRNQKGQWQAAEWIRDELPAAQHPADGRPLQEPYSLRCAPQVIGAVLDQLDLQEQVLTAEAAGVTDNPVTVGQRVLHGGNFHAMPVSFASDMLALCAQQLAFLAERQLALLVDPRHNGGLTPMLTWTPGPHSGLAGVQIAASSMVAKARQLAYPSGLTALPTNMGNQDHVPMALNGAVVGTEVIRYAQLATASLALAATQLGHHLAASPAEGTVWARLHDISPPLLVDRPLAAEVRRTAATLAAAYNPDPRLVDVLSPAGGDNRSWGRRAEPTQDEDEGAHHG
ncbi:aromatic amino acid ammonia-lyase [Streptacidiphilus melanogenes]|uniref:aromatic amino acid ammonia-lyase n=1 Tax=Streptacidiphilus melanogenes TaxID=411235 RepID=UPI0007C75277|nr:aromatic amino acid ammonia-lyase [Streptacidiphilus melanogenes]